MFKLPSNEQTLGVTWFVFHCLMFSIISIISKILLFTLNIFEILFFQTIFATLIMLPVVLTKHREYLKINNYKVHIIRSACWAFASAMFFFSMTQIQIPRAIAISFAVPLFTTIMAVIFLKEALHKPRIISLIFGFIGMLIIIQPGMGHFETASLMVVGAALLWSVTDIIIKLISKQHSALINTFYFAVFSAICMFPFAIYFWRTPDLYEIFVLLLLALVFIINIYSITKAYENADLTIMMPFAFTQLVFVAVLSYIVFSEVMSLSTAIGSAVIIGSTSYIAYREKQKHDRFLAPEIAEEIFED